jgi:hypothetical protein
LISGELIYQSNVDTIEVFDFFIGETHAGRRMATKQWAQERQPKQEATHPTS